MKSKRGIELPPDFLATVKRLREEGAQAQQNPACRRRPPSSSVPPPRSAARLPVSAAIVPAPTASSPASHTPEERGAESDAWLQESSNASVFDGDARSKDSRAFLEKKRRAVPASSFYEGEKSKKWDRQGIRARMLAARGRKFITRLRAAVMRYRCKTVFREFPLQKDAFAYADSLIADQTEDVRVFARELDKTGKRRFFVTTYEECWRRLMRTEVGCRHFYEVIRDGWPCYLYFDIEFKKELNATTDGQRAMAAFLEFLPRGLQTLYPGHEFVFRPGDVIDLDSSTHLKFSHHLIIRPNSAQVVFKDNIHMGACVRRLLQLIQEEVKEGTNKELGHIFVRTSSNSEESTCAGDDRSQPFIDAGVYTKNRCFRTFQSSKYGKKVVLVNAAGCENTYEVHGNDEVLFYKSLVCRLAHPRNFLKILLDPCHQHTLQEPRMDATGSTCSEKGVLQGRPSGHEASVVQGCGDSSRWEGECPLTADEARAWRNIAEHVVGVWNARAGGAPGRVRGVTWMSCRVGSEAAAAGGVGGASNTRGRVASFRVDGNRWCDSIGRQHKSNGILLIVDIGKGCFYQKCFDPDCRSRRSNEFPLPAALVCRLSQVASCASSVDGPVPATPVGSQASTQVALDKEDNWSEEILEGIDELLRQNGLAWKGGEEKEEEEEEEEEEEWSDDVLASIDDFLRRRGLDGRPTCERFGTNNNDDTSVTGCEIWEDEVLDSIDEMVRCHQRSSLQTAEEGSRPTPQSCPDMPENSRQSGRGPRFATNNNDDTSATGCEADASEPRSPTQITDVEFDDACVQAVEEAERQVFVTTSR